MQIYANLCFAILFFVMHPFLTTHYPLDITCITSLFLKAPFEWMAQILQSLRQKNLNNQ